MKMKKNNLENLESEIICSNWISINQFLFDWFLTGSFWLVQFLSDWFRQEAIDMNLCLASFDGSDTAQDVFELNSDPEVTAIKHQKPSTRNDFKNWIFENWYGKENIYLSIENLARWNGKFLIAKYWSQWNHWFLCQTLKHRSGQAVSLFSHQHLCS